MATGPLKALVSVIFPSIRLGHELCGVSSALLLGSSAGKMRNSSITFGFWEIVEACAGYTEVGSGRV